MYAGHGPAGPAAGRRRTPGHRGLDRQLQPGRPRGGAHEGAAPREAGPGGAHGPLQGSQAQRLRHGAAATAAGGLLADDVDVLWRR